MASATLQRVMHRRCESGRTFHVAVVGVSGSETDKGSNGIGKSCLCNRLIRPHADDYHSEHISVLSQTDFGGRVVNNEHFLYWGDTQCVSDEGATYRFHVVEQTEFVDDASFQPFNNGKMDVYARRCAATRLHSAEKLMYVCKNQLGIEREYEQKVLPDGRFCVDGFVCVFDVSEVSGRSLARHVEQTAQILNSVVRTKKPVVLATTKNDEARPSHVREAARLASRREYKGNIPLVETSAQCNINVHLAFITVAQLASRGRGSSRIRLLPYTEAARLRRQQSAVITDAFQTLISATVTNHRCSWPAAFQLLRGSRQMTDFLQHHGLPAARHVFSRHVQHVREQHVSRRVQRHLPALARALSALLDDRRDILPCSWAEARRFIIRHADFDRYFVDTSSAGALGVDTDEEAENVASDEADEQQHTDGRRLKTSRSKMIDERVPVCVLDTVDAEIVFKNFINDIQMRCQQDELCEQFGQLLADSGYVTPGASLAELSVLFLGRHCYEALTDQQRTAVYQQHQHKLVHSALLNFQELLLERVDLLCQLNDETASMPVGDTGATYNSITADEMTFLVEHLQQDIRFRMLERLSGERYQLLARHVTLWRRGQDSQCVTSCVSPPAITSSLRQVVCVDLLAEQLLSSSTSSFVCRASASASTSSLSSSLAPRPAGAGRAAGGEHTRPVLRVAVAGESKCAQRLTQTLQLRCDEDSELEIDSRAYCVDVAVFSQPAGLTVDSLTSDNFHTHGCLCVYGDWHSLQIARACAESVVELNKQQQTVTSTVGWTDVCVVIVFTVLPAVQSSLVFDDVTERNRLREQGVQLARSLQCQFVDCSDRCLTSDDVTAEDTEESTDDLTTASSQERREDGLLSALSSFASRALPATADDDEGGDEMTSHTTRRHSASLADVMVNNSGGRLVKPHSDIRILMCMFCGDPYGIDSLLGGIVADGSSQSSDGNSLLMDVFLGDSRRQAEVVISSYHSAGACLRRQVVHGVILVYSARRRASLNNLSVLSRSVAHLPLQILAVTEFVGGSGGGGGGGVFDSQLTLDLITDGNSLADSLQAHFMTSTSTCRQKTAFYLSFFREVWDRRPDTERLYQNQTASYNEQCFGGASHPADGVGGGGGKFTSGRPRSRQVTTTSGSQPVINSSEDISSSEVCGGMPLTDGSQECDTATSATASPPYHSAAAVAAATVSSHLPYVETGHRRYVGDHVAGSASRPSSLAAVASASRRAHGDSNGHAASHSRRSLPHDIFGADQFASTESLPVSGGGGGEKHSRRRERRPFTRAHTDQSQSDAPAKILTDPAKMPPDPSTSDGRSAGRRHGDRQRHSLRQPSVDDSSDLSHSAGLCVFPAPSTPPEPAPSGHHHHHHHHHHQEQRRQRRPATSSRQARANTAVATTTTTTTAEPATLSSNSDSDRFCEWMLDEEEEDGNGDGDVTNDVVHDDVIDSNCVENTATASTSSVSCGRPDNSWLMSHQHHHHHHHRLQHHQRHHTVSSSSGHGVPVRSSSASLVQVTQPGRLNMNRYVDVAGALAKLSGDPAARGQVTGQRAATSQVTTTAATTDLTSLSAKHHHMLAAEYAQVKDAIQSRGVASDGGALTSGGGGGSHAGSHSNKYQLRLRTEHNRQYLSDSDSECSGVDATNTNTAAGISSAVSTGGATTCHRTPPRRTSQAAGRRRAAIPVCVPRVPVSTTTTVPTLPPANTGGTVVEACDGDDVMTSREPYHLVSDALQSPTVVSAKEERTRQKHMKRLAKQEEKRRCKQEEKQRKIDKERCKKDKSKKNKNSAQTDKECHLHAEHLPPFLTRCVALIEADGLDTEGLYRVPGNRAQVDLVTDQLTLDSHAIINTDDVTVQAVATALKDFISKRLPPLVPLHKLSDLTNIAGVSDRRTRLFKLRVLLRELPTANFNVLKFMFQHFQRVCEHHRVNGMDAKNLAICWWPTLLPLQFDDMAAFEAIRPHVEELVQTMIDQLPYLFEDKEERMMV